jgi:hypothetical protein
MKQWSAYSPLSAIQLDAALQQSSNYCKYEQLAKLQELLAACEQTPAAT